MYESYWGLTGSPFRIAADDRWFYESPGHEEALARMYFLIEERRPCGVLQGTAGSGKTLLFRMVERELARTQRNRAVIDLTGLDGDELLWELAETLELTPADGEPSRRLWQLVEDQLAALSLSGLETVILFDAWERSDAGCTAVVERLLGSTGGRDGGLTVLVGVRARPDAKMPGVLAELSDLRIELHPLDRVQTAGYVRSHLAAAGVDGEIFDREALDAVCQHSGGVPRQVNRLCHFALLAAMGENRRRVDAGCIARAARELRLGGRPAAEPAVTPVLAPA
ncbi:MAG TPA: AAA family ATPase [Planctomycetaceae bacterium]|nr:AAA family ATPase [Planctomycetaceae bacterium]